MRLTVHAISFPTPDRSHSVVHYGPVFYGSLKQARAVAREMNKGKGIICPSCSKAYGIAGIGPCDCPRPESR